MSCSSLAIIDTACWLLQTQSRIPRQTQALALAFFSDHYKANQLNEQEVLSEMPPAMSEEFRRHLYHRFLKTVPLFSELSDQVISTLCSVRKHSFE